MWKDKRTIEEKSVKMIKLSQIWVWKKLKSNFCFQFCFYSIFISNLFKVKVLKRHAMPVFWDWPVRKRMRKKFDQIFFEQKFLPKSKGWWLKCRPIGRIVTWGCRQSKKMEIPLTVRWWKFFAICKSSTFFYFESTIASELQKFSHQTQ